MDPIEIVINFQIQTEEVLLILENGQLVNAVLISVVFSITFQPFYYTVISYNNQFL